MAVKCPKCEFENREGVKFCEKCGVKLELVCPTCKAKIPLDREFCGECGQALAKPPALVDYSKPQTYTPKFLAEKILSTGKSLEGERKLVTVLFADVAGYTAMSEKLDPEEVHQIMEGCFQILMDEIHRYEGTIDKFTGDGVMALFGAPLAHEDHAQRACYAALAIQKALETYGHKVEKDCRIPFKVKVGLNSGPVIVGSVGKDLKMDYTAVGDTVNLASRMQTMAEPGRVLVSADVHKMARDFFNFKSRGKMSVKGKEEAVETYELLEPTEVASRIEASVLRGLTRFVGREKEMATLREAFDKAKSGSGQVVCIVGEAGVGKSRLLLELRRTTEPEEYTYLEGQCLHYGSSMPYLPLLDILRSCFGLKEGEREFLVRKRLEEKTSAIDPKLKAILPPLQELLSLKVEDEAYLKLEPQKKREKIFEAIRDLLVVESQKKPLVIAVEDLHWIDKTSEEFLAYFIGHLPNSRILLLLLYRPEYTHQWSSKSCYSQIRVDELPAKSSADLVRAMLEEGEVAPELRELILKRAAGNPLFMEEFTHTLLENGSIQKKDRQYVLSRKPSEIHVPDTIQGIIAARMDRLDDNLKRIMQVASVIGRDFAYRILQTITGMQDELKGHLVNLQGLEFIYEKSLYPELEYVFKHALTQEVAYNSLLLKRRKQIHEKIGKAIEELYPDRLEEFCEALAHHWSMAEDWEAAYRYLVMSGTKASNRYSSWEALRFLKEAVNVLTKLPATEDNKRRGIETRLAMVIPMMGLAFPEDSIEILKEGERLSEEIGDLRSLGRFRGGMGMYYAMIGNSEQGARYLEGAFRAAERMQDLEVLVPAGFQLCGMALIRGEYHKITQVAPRVIDLLEHTHRERDSFGWAVFNPYSALVSTYAMALASVGNLSEAQAHGEKGLRFATEINDLASIAYAECMCGEVFMLLGDRQNTVELGRNAVRHSEEAQLLSLVGAAWNCLGYGYRYLGDAKAALNCLQKAVESMESSGFTGSLPMIYSNLGEMYCDAGDMENARYFAEKALQLAHEDAGGFFEGYIRTYSGWVLGRMDGSRFAEAEKCVLQGLKILGETEGRPYCAYGFMYLGELYADAGENEKALASLRRALEMYQEMGIEGYWVARTEKALDGLQA